MNRKARSAWCVAAVALALAGLFACGARAADDPKQPFFSYRSFWPEFAAMRQFKEAGVNTVCIFAANTANSLGQPYSKYPPVWRWFGKVDFDSLNRQFDDVLAVNPDADFICMIDLNTPIWLQRQLALGGHSAECESFTMLSCVCANPAWRKATAEYLEAVVKHMEKRYGDRVKAYLLACGQTDEWMDYSRGVAGRAKAQAWRAWRQAHGNKPETPFRCCGTPRSRSFDNLIRDPATEQDVVDYAVHRRHHRRHGARAGREDARLVPKRRQIGMFFGYIIELTNARMVWAGHLEYERLYSSPDFDFFISPGTYGDRPMGGGSGLHGPERHSPPRWQGILARDRPSHADLQRQAGRVRVDRLDGARKDQAETDAGLKREFALAIVNRLPCGASTCGAGCSRHRRR